MQPENTAVLDLRFKIVPGATLSTPVVTWVSEKGGQLALRSRHEYALEYHIQFEYNWEATTSTPVAARFLETLRGSYPVPRMIDIMRLGCPFSNSGSSMRPVYRLLSRPPSPGSAVGLLTVHWTGYAPVV
jgi:hypothetical protein